MLDLYAGGMSVRDIAAHLRRLYGVEIGRDTISRVTDAVLEDIAAWRARPLEQVYPIVYFDALQVEVTEDRSVRTRACYLAVGVTCDGDREALGIWWQDSEGAKSWLAVLNDLRPRRSSGSPAAASDPGRSRDRFSSLLVAAEDRSAPGPSYAKVTPWRNALTLFPRR